MLFHLYFFGVWSFTLCLCSIAMNITRRHIFPTPLEKRMKNIIIVIIFSLFSCVLATAQKITILVFMVLCVSWCVRSYYIILRLIQLTLGNSKTKVIAFGNSGLWFKSTHCSAMNFLLNFGSETLSFGLLPHSSVRWNGQSQTIFFPFFRHFFFALPNWAVNYFVLYI